MVGTTLFLQVRHALHRLCGHDRRGEEGGGPLLTHIHLGMEVVSAYGRPIGTITAIWRGQDPLEPGAPCDLERCSRLQLQYRAAPLYIPYSAIAAVCDGRVRLTVETTQATRGPWQYRPEWLPLVEPPPPRSGTTHTVLRACAKVLRTQSE